MPRASRFAVILVGLYFIHGPCCRASASTDFSFYHENVLGTSLELCIRADSLEAARLAEHRVLTEIDRLALIFSGYDPSTEFSRWQAAPRTPRRVSPELFEVLDTSDSWRTRSRGAFDPRVAVFSRLWTRCSQLGRLPTDQETLAARSVFTAPAWRLNAVTHTAERLTDCPLSLDGIAKGFIVERSCDAALNGSPGVSGILLNVGGDLRVRGDFAQTIGIAAPWADSESSEPYLHIEVKNGSVATSGKSRRGYQIKDKWYSHVFDPRTGSPVERVAAVTVVADRGADADALAKICGVLDPEQSLRLVHSLPGVDCLIFTADGQVAKSTGWSQRERPRPNALAMAQQRNTFTRSSAGEPPGEPQQQQLARTEPRPPGITQEHLGRSRSEIKATGLMRPTDEPKAASKKSARPAWNKEFELVVNFEINHPQAENGRYRRPYIAVWVEDTEGHAVRTLALWVSMGGAGPFQWLPDLKRWYKSEEERKLAEKTDIFFTTARPTRLPGQYKLIWDGKDNNDKQLGGGNYTIFIEAAREHGTYQSIRQNVSLSDQPFRKDLKGNVEIRSASIEYRRDSTPK